MGKKEKKKDAKKALKKAEKAAAKKAKKEAATVEAPEAVEEPKQVAPVYVPVEGDPVKTISIKMPVSLVEAADAAAKAYGEEGVSRSEFIRTAIEKLVNQG